MLFKRLLIANRGEIAIRVMRTCRELDIETVAVYVPEDRDSLYVKYADTAVPLRGDTIEDTYLNVAQLAGIVGSARCDAVHPGYGFLSENAAFAAAVEAAGAAFVGPGAAVMQEIADKGLLVRRMRDAGVPVAPSMEYTGDMTALRAFARHAGYPLLVKPAFGGGGKGMKAVAAEQDLEKAVAFAQRIGKTAFGSAALYVEKFIANPQHIEVQVLGDARGHLVVLGERDCSIQRRHQKLVEETPSPALDPLARARVHALALDTARILNYSSAGTFEFLHLDGQFYFLEINARIQVEHPVTEMATGLDLVKEQIRIAAGGCVPDTFAPRGHAMECRVNAEDPFRNFFPSPGTISEWREPGGPFVRVDAGVAAGSVVSPSFDSLLAKVCVWGRDRTEAAARMRRALDEFCVEGLATTLPALRAIFRDQVFLAGGVDTSYMDTRFRQILAPET